MTAGETRETSSHNVLNKCKRHAAKIKKKKNMAEEEANGEAKKVKEHSLRCREPSSAWSSRPRSLPSLRLHSGVGVGVGVSGSFTCHPCRSTIFERRNLTDILKGPVEEVLDSSFERIKVQLVEDNKIKCVSSMAASNKQRQEKQELTHLVPATAPPPGPRAEVETEAQRAHLVVPQAR